jgi:hypothetical protein
VTNVNTIMNLGVADYDGLQTQISYRGNAKMFLQVSYTLSKATKHERAGRQWRRQQPGEHPAARRGGSRTERRRSATPGGDHVPLPAAVQHHGRHPHDVRVGASNQSDDRRRQRRRWRHERSAGQR